MDVRAKAALGLAAGAAAVAVAVHLTRRRQPQLRGIEAEHPPTREVESWAALGAGTALVPFVFELPYEPPAGFVDVRVTHCGVCHSDLHQIDDAWGAACFPLVAGHEIVGEVVTLGEGVHGLAVGDAVAIGVQRGNCAACAQCRARREHLCPKILKTYAGPGKDCGGFANFIRYPAAWVFQCPPQLPRELIAPLMCAGITTFSPLKRFAKKGDKVGIAGVGGLGHIALQIAKAMGAAEVVAISGTSSKEAEARGFGASSFLLSSDAAAMADAAGSFDLILNTVSGHAPLDPLLALLQPRGKLVCVGLPEKTERCFPCNPPTPAHPEVFYLSNKYCLPELNHLCECALFKQVGAGGSTLVGRVHQGVWDDQCPSPPPLPSPPLVTGWLMPAHGLGY